MSITKDEVDTVLAVPDKSKDGPIDILAAEMAAPMRPTVLYRCHEALAAWARGCCYDDMEAAHRALMEVHEQAARHRLEDAAALGDDEQLERALRISQRLCFNELTERLRAERRYRGQGTSP